MNGLQWLKNRLEPRLSTLENRWQWDIWGGSSPASHQVPDTVRWSVFSGTATTTVTLVMPNSPFDGQEIAIISKAAWTTVIHSPGNAGQALLAPLTTLGAANPKEWVWCNSQATWFKLT
jgi:hypothetical protein